MLGSHCSDNEAECGLELWNVRFGNGNRVVYHGKDNQDYIFGICLLVKSRFEKAVKEGMSLGLEVSEIIFTELELACANVIQEIVTQILSLQVDSVVQQHELFFFK